MPFVVENGYRIFTDLEGQPLDSGYIFIGEDGLNPLTNPQTAYFDEALTIPAENIRTSGGYAVYRGSPATIYTLNDYSILVQDKNQQTVYYNPSVSALEVGPVSLDLSTLANGYLPVGFAAPDTGVTFPGFVAAGTENLSATLYPELYAQVASQDFLSDNGDGTFNVLNTGLDTGWVSNSTWQAATFTILHSLNQGLSNLEISFEVSELGTDNTAIRPLDVAYDAASGADAVKGITYHGSNSNQFLVKTGTNGIDYIDTDGTRATLTTESWFYRIKVKRKDMPYPAQVKAQVTQNGDALTTLMNETGWIANSDWTAATFTFTHSLDILNPFMEFWISTDGTWENAFRVDSATQTTSTSGVTFFIRDNNTVEVQTATNGVYVTTDNDTIVGTPGASRSIQTESWFYNIIVYKPQLITNITQSTGADGLLGLDLVAVEYSAPNILVKVGSKIEANGIVYTIQGSDVSLTAADGNLCYNPVSGFFIDDTETPVYDPAKGGYYINTTNRVTKWKVDTGDFASPVIEVYQRTVSSPDDIGATIERVEFGGAATEVRANRFRADSIINIGAFGAANTSINSNGLDFSTGFSHQGFGFEFATSPGNFDITVTDGKVYGVQNNSGGTITVRVSSSLQTALWSFNGSTGPSVIYAPPSGTTDYSVSNNNFFVVFAFPRVN